MKALDRKRRSATRRRERDLGGHRRLSDLLDDDHVGGILARIRAVGCLIGATSEVDLRQISTAGWLVEALADEAKERLRREVARAESGKAGGRRRRP